MPWESPINIDYTPFYEQIVDAQENAIYKAVLKVNISVDREEMVKALKYDRQQYEKGYADGRADAVEQIVRCHQCKYWESEDWCMFHDFLCHEDYYCADGERREDD